MTDRDRAGKPPFDESTSGGSSAETGGIDDDQGPTIAGPTGDRIATDEFKDLEGPGSDPGDAYRRAVEAGQVQPDEDDDSSVGIEDVYRSGS